MPGAHDWLVKLLARLSPTYGPGEIDAARQPHVRFSQKVYPQKRKVMGYPVIPGALFDSSHRWRYVELNGPAALHRLPLFLSSEVRGVVGCGRQVTHLCESRTRFVMH